jgi:hypothetical protein
VRDKNLRELSGAGKYVKITRAPQTPTDLETFYVDDGTNFEAGTLWWGSKVLLLDESAIGDPGFEQGGVTVAGVNFNAIWKVNDINGGGRSAICVFHRHSTVDASNVLATRSNSNTAAHGVVANNMELGNYFWGGWDGASYQLAGAIRCVVDGVPGINDMPGRVEILTTPNGTIVPILRFRVTNDGIVNLQNGVRPGDGTLGNGGRLHSGAGVPAGGLGDNGDYYFRSDGGVGTHIYFKSGGAWAGIV